METCDKSLPIFLHSKFHKERPSVFGRGHGNLVLRPVMFVETEPSTVKKLNTKNENKQLNSSLKPNF